jgi:hypothetical protein
MPTITPLPTPPSRQDPVNFSARADAFLAALPTMVTEFNAATPGDSAAGLAGSLGSPAVGSGSKIVAFMQRISGAVARWVEDKLSETVSIEDFGGDPTGVSDSTAVVQAAITDAAARRKTLKVTGLYRLTSKVTVPLETGVGVGLVIEGDGPGCGFIVDHTGDGIEISYPSYADMGTSATLRNLKFKNGTATPASFVRNKQGINTLLDRCFFTGAVTYAVVNDTAYGLSLSHCVINDITGSGLLLKQTPTDTLYSFVVEVLRCDFSTISGTAISAQGGNTWNLTGTVIQECNKGLSIDPITSTTGAFNVLIIGGWFERNTAVDIEFLSNATYWCEGTLLGTRIAGFNPTYQGHVTLGSRSRLLALGCSNAGNTVIVTGSGTAGFTAIHSTGYSQSGSFYWVSLDQAGGFSGGAAVTSLGIVQGTNIRASAVSAGVAGTTTIGSGTSTTVGAAGGAAALPATPLGYIVGHIGTTQIKIPYYNI